LVTYYHCDRNGSTLALTNAAGAVTDSYAYTPYGEQLGHNGSSTQPFTFVGCWGVRAEPVAGLFHMRSRYYDPVTARFLTRDPAWPNLTQPRQLDPYLYAAGDPVTMIDITGRSPAPPSNDLLEPVSPALKGQYTSDFIAGVEYEVSDELVVGGPVHRDIGRVLEEISVDGASSYFMNQTAPSLNDVQKVAQTEVNRVLSHLSRTAGRQPAFGGGLLPKFSKPAQFINKAAGDFDIDLTSSPLHGLLAYSSAGNSDAVGFHGSGGLRVTQQLGPDVDSGFDSYADTFTFCLGGGLKYGLNNTWALAPGLQHHQTHPPAESFDLNANDDSFSDEHNPKFLLLNLGAPHGARE
jgi:RHS repeat-associated protein